MKIQHRLTGAVLFEDLNESTKQTVLAALASRADLSRADLSRADLSRADLSRADLSRADLSEANLSEANLSEANLSEANLYRTNLIGANLIGANLIGANLTGANLTGANLIGANLIGAVGAFSLGNPNNWTAFAWLQDGYLAIRVGCRNKRLDEARAYWSSPDHPQLGERREVLAALDYAEAVAKLRGWPIEAPTLRDVAEQP